MSEWIEWEGGDCPVPAGTLLDIKHRNGKIKSCIPALGANSAGPSYWYHDDMNVDIVAYRLHVKEEVKEYDWITHNGGDCPVHKGIMINAKYRSGVVRENQSALHANSWAANRFWIHSDHPNDIIAYQLCEKQKQNPWEVWHGGDCPVPKGTLVDVRYRNGEENMSVPALSQTKNTGQSYWQNEDGGFDIVAYRLSDGATKPEPAKQTETLRVLTQEALELQEEFESLYDEKGSCTCHMGNPPCSSCTHPGHPIAIEENEQYWRSVEVDIEEIAKHSEPVDLIWGSW